MSNAHIAAAFEELADLYELDGAVSYRVLAYRTAARAVREAPVSVMQLAREGKATELPGIGRTLEEKLKALDVIATAADPAGLVRTLTDLPLVETVEAAGDAGARVLTHTGMKVDLKV